VPGPDDDVPEVLTPAPQGGVTPPTIAGLPDGFVYGVTRYADVILQTSFPRLLEDVRAALAALEVRLDELAAGGGSRTDFVRRFDASLEARGWGKRRIEIAKTIDGRPVSQVRGHEIDMFAAGSAERPYPGVAVEMEWNNKDPFFDRDLLNYQALHREAALAVGAIVTRGPRLQRLIQALIPGGRQKYGTSTTHWEKLIPRVNLGGGGECPLLLVGIEPQVLTGFEDPAGPDALERLESAVLREAGWREHFPSKAAATAALGAVVAETRRALGMAAGPP
jgi:hypothetical protein